MLKSQLLVSLISLNLTSNLQKGLLAPEFRTKLMSHLTMKLFTSSINYLRVRRKPHRNRSLLYLSINSSREKSEEQRKSD